MRKQSMYIRSRLQSRSCQKKCSPDSPEANRIREILQKRFTSGMTMDELGELIDKTISDSRQPLKQSCIYNVSKRKQDWFSNMKKIVPKSAEGIVQTADVSGIPIIIKTPHKPEQNDNILREYYIGKNGINSLRYIIPNFVHTLGIFHCQQKEIILACEKIPGITLDKALKTNKLTFEMFTNIFCQLLLALEIAQRECCFCHYDLHASNIVLRPIQKPYSYTVVIDQKEYHVVATKYIPTIIDFGTSTIKMKNKTIGNYLYDQFGMEHYAIPGVDMYKMLFYSYIASQGNLQRQIGQLFFFYGDNDPYKILISSDKLKEISKDYVKNISNSYSSTFIPHDFLTWILSDKNFKISIQVFPRKIYLPIQKDFQSIIVPEKVFQVYKDSKSYITRKYISKITKADEENEKDKKFIKEDKKILQGFKKIHIPDKFKIEDLSKQILSGTAQKKDIEEFINEAKFITELAPYLQFFYTIQELNLEKTFITFMDSFQDSPQYRLYVTTSSLIERTRRWCTCLLESELKT